MFIKIDALQLSHWSIEVLIEVGCTSNIFTGELVFLQLSLLEICELFPLGGSEKTFSLLCYVRVFFAFLEEKRANKSCVWDTVVRTKPPPPKKKKKIGSFHPYTGLKCLIFQFLICHFYFALNYIYFTEHYIVAVLLNSAK